MWRPRSSHVRLCLNHPFVAHFIWQKASSVWKDVWSRLWCITHNYGSFQFSFLWEIEQNRIYILFYFSEEAELKGLIFVVHHLVGADTSVQETNKQGNKTSCNMLGATLRYFPLLLSVAVGGYQFSWDRGQKKKKNRGWHCFNQLFKLFLEQELKMAWAYRGIAHLTFLLW